MKTNILLVRSHSLIGKLIRFFNKNYYNHVGIFVSDFQIVEATFTGVKLTHIDKFIEAQKRGLIVCHIYKVKDIIELQKETVCNFVLNRVGRKYDFLQFLSLTFFFIFNMSRKKYESLDSGRCYICSELIAKAYAQVNIYFNNEVDLDNITPADIANSEIIEKL